MRRIITRVAFAAVLAAAALVTMNAQVSAARAAPPRVQHLTLRFFDAQVIASPHRGTLTFHARLSSAAASAVTVHYSTANGTARAGTDYVATSGTFKIAARHRSGSITVKLLPVTLGQGGSNKTLSLRLSRPRGALLSTRSVTGTVHPDVYVTGASDVFADVVINPLSTFAFFTVPAKNEVAVLNLRTGIYGKPIPVGSDPQGIDITPDGTTLFVCDSGGQTISKVIIATRKVTTIITPPGLLSDTPFSIAIMNNRHALYSTTFSGSGFGANVYDLNLRTGVSSVVTTIGLVTEFTVLSRSSDHSTVGVVVGDDSGGPFDIYKAATGHVVSGSLNTFTSSGSLNRDGSTMLIDGSYVVDTALGALLGTISDSCGSATLTANGSTGYCLEAQAIAQLNVGRFLVGTVIKLPQSAAGGSQLALSDNGHILVAETGGGATIIEV